MITDGTPSALTAFEPPGAISGGILLPPTALEGKNRRAAASQFHGYGAARGFSAASEEFSQNLRHTELLGRCLF